MRQILIVEDDITLNQGLCKALKNDKWHIVSCGTAKERDQFAVGDVSLVLLDINLPDGNGIDLLKEFKLQKPAVPVIMLTANDTDMDIVNGLEQGADDYIAKPFRIRELLARIKAIMRRTGRMVTAAGSVGEAGSGSNNSSSNGDRGNDSSVSGGKRSADSSLDYCLHL